MACYLQVTKFFGFLENIYNIFSGTTDRHTLLKLSIIGTDKRVLAPKRVKTTRGESWAEATKSLNARLDVYKTTLTKLSVENHEAKSLLKILNKLKTHIYIFFWDNILNIVNKLNLKLQCCNTDLNTAILLLKSLKSSVTAFRNEFEFYENLGKEEFGINEYASSQKRPRKESASFIDGT